MRSELSNPMLLVATVAWLTLVTVGLTACVGVSGEPARVAMDGADSALHVLRGAAFVSGQVIGGAVDKSGEVAVSVLDWGPAPDAGFLLEPARMVEFGG